MSRRFFSLFTATTAAEVEECLARGDNLEEEREIGRVKLSPLISSIKRGNKEVFFSLLQHGANPNYSPLGTKRPIQWAAAEGWRDMIEALVKAGANVNDSSGGFWGSPLFIAADRGAVDVTEGLLALGADTEVKYRDGRTPLIKAIERGHVDVVDRLLAAEACVNSLDNYRSRSPLVLASILGRVEIVDRLVIHGADINLQNHEGLNALMWACYHGHFSVVDRLVGLGCDLDLQAKFGWTSLMWACKEGHVEIVKILLTRGADTQIKDNNGQKAIDLARSQEIKDLLQG